MVKVEFHTPAPAELGVLCWRFDRPMAVLSSAAVGGGARRANWVTNVRVPLKYDRIDLAVHAQEVASALDLEGDGVTLFTATPLERRARSGHRDVVVDATSGVTKPTWAADEGGGWTDWQPGTINIVAQLPTPLTPAAAVNAVITMTEAKTQALFDLGIPGTGTASDAVVVCWPDDGTEPEVFGGPRSPLGSSLAIATHAAVHQSAGANQR